MISKTNRYLVIAALGLASLTGCAARGDVDVRTSSQTEENRRKSTTSGSASGSATGSGSVSGSASGSGSGSVSGSGTVRE